MRTEARFPEVGERAAHYESFYLKAARPGGGQGIWIRYTVHKPPGEPPSASIWVTLFDADAAAPRATKMTLPAAQLSAPPGGYIEIGGARLEPGRACGEIGSDNGVAVSWELEFGSPAQAFRHLPSPFLYRAPLPRTKLLTPHPDVRFTGTVTVDGRPTEIDSWLGMVGHNWGSEHAERWIWMHAGEFRQAEGWFDAALGRIKVGPLTTPWIANGAIALDGEIHRLGGLDRIRSTRVGEQPTGCEFELSGAEGLKVRGRVLSEPRNFVGWVYADPAGPEHNALNCSISDMELRVERKGAETRLLECVGGAAYEIGMRERDHGIELQPFPDG